MKNLLDWSRWKRVYENTETQTLVVDPFTTPMIDKEGKKMTDACEICDYLNRNSDIGVDDESKRVYCDRCAKIKAENREV
jgi:hypothetical protein